MKRPEQTLQITVAKFCELALRPPVVFTAINPMPYKSRAAAGLSKAMGMQAGVPDLLFMAPGIIGWIELKAHTRKPKADQVWMHERLRACGHHTAVCTDLDQVIGTLRGWGIPVMAQARAA